MSTDRVLRVSRADLNKVHVVCFWAGAAAAAESEVARHRFLGDAEAARRTRTSLRRCPSLLLRASTACRGLPGRQSLSFDFSLKKMRHKFSRDAARVTLSSNTISHHTENIASKRKKGKMEKGQFRFFFFEGNLGDSTKQTPLETHHFLLTRSFTLVRFRATRRN